MVEVNFLIDTETRGAGGPRALGILHMYRYLYIAAYYANESLFKDDFSERQTERKGERDILYLLVHSVYAGSARTGPGQSQEH